MQQRLLHKDLSRQRTALQYFEQLLDIFTCSDLVTSMFHFLTGLPSKTKEEELRESDDLDSSSYQSRLSMSIEGSSLQIGRKLNNNSTNVSLVGESDTNLRSGAVADHGLLSHF